MKKIINIGKHYFSPYGNEEMKCICGFVISKHSKKENAEKEFINLGGDINFCKLK